MEMIERYPDKEWNWNEISMNPNITMKDIERHIKKPWNWFWITQNPNITVQFIERHKNKINVNDLAINMFSYPNKNIPLSKLQNQVREKTREIQDKLSKMW